MLPIPLTRKPKPKSAATQKTILINGTVVPTTDNETLLQAALKGGVDFPNSCRVGGCATCKCRLVEGKVKELTETGYILSQQELEQGFILACQSIPQSSDVRVEVDLQQAATPQHAKTMGRVIAQERLTHDITCLRVQLDAPLPYKAGQFAMLALVDRLGVEVRRNYSFATPFTDDGIVSFYVRAVKGGVFSSLVHEEDLKGERVAVEGPFGDFWLRPTTNEDEDPSKHPLLFVAGGSGLAPILAILEAADKSQLRRPVTLLFGGRQERDLYARDRIEKIAASWQASFDFQPVLSEEEESSQWTGARGLVTDRITDAANTNAYLCGPPGMVDAGLAKLSAALPKDRIHFDRFEVTSKQTEEEDVSPLHYLKFFSFHAIGLISAIALLFGGRFTTAALLSVLSLYIIGDALSGDDLSIPKYKHPRILTAQLWLALPLLAFIIFAGVVSVNRGILGSGHLISGWVLTSLMIGMVGTIPAHELTHRTWDPISMFVGRWLLAFSFDTSFAIEHVYGHHRYVATLEDPATAPRGRNVYFHIVASALKGNVSAWKIEQRRLRHRGIESMFTIHNAVLRGYAMSAMLIAFAFALGGPRGALFFIASALGGKALLEIVNYMEHYGIVRNPKTPVQPRHSWNTNRRVSSWTMFNLTRHSHHHAQGEVPYYELEPFPKAPQMISGYLTTIIVALIPPLWHRLMTPKLQAWDEELATSEERHLADQANSQRALTPPWCGSLEMRE